MDTATIPPWPCNPYPSHVEEVGSDLDWCMMQSKNVRPYFLSNKEIGNLFRLLHINKFTTNLASRHWTARFLYLSSSA